MIRQIRLGQAAIVIAGLLLIAVTWIGTLDAVRAERAQATAHASADVANQALVFEQELRRQFLTIDQTIGILEREWERNPTEFDLNAWRTRTMVLADIALHVIITDANGLVVASTRPELLGQTIAGREYFRNRRDLPTDDGRMFIGPATRGMVTAAWQMNLVRRLDHADGRFAGVIAMSYDTSVLTKFFRAADLGATGLIALIGTGSGQLHALVGPVVAEPGGNIVGTPMFRAMAAQPSGIWIGPSAPDEIIRINAFRRVVGRDLSVVVGIDLQEALRASQAWERGALIFASVITVVLITMTVALLVARRAARSRESQLNHDRAVLEAANIDLVAARALADARAAQLQATLLGMSDGVALIGPDFRLVQWNPHFAEYTGVPADILRVGLPMADILRAQARAGEFGPVDVEAEVAWRIEALRVGNLAGTRERARPDGRILELRRSFLPTGGFVTLYTDITKRKQAEDALREARALAETAMEDKSRFVAMVSHEIRTPLTTLLNGVALLAESPLAALQRGLVDMARRAGDALLGLVNDILEMSRMEAGQLSMDRSEFPLRPLLEGVLDMFRTEAQERGIELRLQIGAGVPRTLTTDPSRLRQVLINLVSNATKFSAPGEVLLEVATTIETATAAPGLPGAGNRRLRIAVRDPGVTIDPADRARLFQPFARLEHGIRNKQPGTGLGLAICQRLASLLDGEIGYLPLAVSGGMDQGIESWQGNEFWLSLPLRDNPRLTENRGQLKTQKLLPRTRILLVEDIPANQLLTATLLRRRGHLVDVANGGEEALNAIARIPYDIVLMDIFMPGMDGYEATRQLRAQGRIAGSLLANLPILALTANAGPEERARCRAAGMNDVLSKPVEVLNLLAAVSRFAWPANPNRGLNKLPTGAPPEKGTIDIAVKDPDRASSNVVSPVDEAQPTSLVPTRMAELRANLAPELLRRLVDDCLEELTARLPALQGLLISGTPGEIEAEAHAMSGMAASYAMGALDCRLRAVIRATRTGGAEAARAAAAGIEREFESTRIALNAAFVEQPAATAD